MLAGAAIAVLLIAIVAIAIWLALSTGSGFEQTLLIVVAAIAFAVVGGYFTADSSSIVGFVTRWKADLALLFPLPDDEDDLLRDTRRTRNAFLVVAILGVLAVFIYALQWKPAGFAQVFGSALMVALAALGAGILLGFLFGIPRTLSDDLASRAPVMAPAGESAGAGASVQRSAAATTSAAFGVNTNLEQISDWLTKIIVGLGLINLDDLPAKIHTFISQIAPSVGGDYAFALAIVVSYVLCGFMMGYLLTRLYLARAFARANALSIQSERAAAGIRQEVERVGNETATKVQPETPIPDKDPISPEEKVAAVRVERLAAKADIENLRLQVEALAHEYESVRSAMSPGPARTRRMEIVATKMRTISGACYELLPSLVLSLSPGQRLAAISFLEARPNREYLEWLAGRFSVEMPFLLYHAAWALRHAAGQLPVSDLNAVERAIESALNTIRQHPDPDRNALDTLIGASNEVTLRRKNG